jgi:hypothetical protein
MHFLPIRPLPKFVICLVAFLASGPLYAQKADTKKAQPISGPWVLTDRAGKSTGGTFQSLDSEQFRWQGTENKDVQKIEWPMVYDIRRNVESATFAYTDATLGPYILLPEGDRLRGESVTLIENRGLAIQSLSAGVLNLPIDRWAGSFFKPPKEPDAFLTMIDDIRRGSEKPGDMITLGNGDRLSGTLTTLVGESLSFQPSGSTKEIKLNRADLQALSTDPAGVKYEPEDSTTWEISLGDGSRISAKTILLNAVDGEDVISITTRWGAGLNLPLAKVIRIRPIPVGSIHLDTRKPDAIQTVAYIGTTPQPRFGANVKGSPIQIGGRWFDRGIGTQSRTLIAYRLSGSEKRFSAWLGLDQSAGPIAHARATVILDGKPVYDSGPLLSGEAPRPVNVELGSARLLILATEFGEGGSVRDWVNWAEPLLLPGPAK